MGYTILYPAHALSLNSHAKEKYNKNLSFSIGSPECHSHSHKNALTHDLLCCHTQTHTRKLKQYKIVITCPEPLFYQQLTNHLTKRRIKLMQKAFWVGEKNKSLFGRVLLTRCISPLNHSLTHTSNRAEENIKCDEYQMIKNKCSFRKSQLRIV